MGSGVISALYFLLFSSCLDNTWQCSGLSIQGSFLVELRDKRGARIEIGLTSYKASALSAVLWLQVLMPSFDEFLNAGEDGLSLLRCS